jgi:hypothetical protein
VTDDEHQFDDRPWTDPDDFLHAGPDTSTYEETRYPVRRTSTARTRQRSRRAATPSARPGVHIPAALTAVVAAQDRFLLAAVGLSGFSLLMMAATVSSRSDALPTWIVTHLDAAGNPDQWGTSATVWRVPLMTAMLTLGNFICAVFLTRRDAFAARFLVAAALLVHVLAWIGLVRILW